MTSKTPIMIAESWRDRLEADGIDGLLEAISDELLVAREADRDWWIGVTGFFDTFYLAPKNRTLLLEALHSVKEPVSRELLSLREQARCLEAEIAEGETLNPDARQAVDTLQREQKRLAAIRSNIENLKTQLAALQIDMEVGDVGD